MTHKEAKSRAKMIENVQFIVMIVMIIGFFIIQVSLIRKSNASKRIRQATEQMELLKTGSAQRSVESGLKPTELGQVHAALRIEHSTPSPPAAADWR
eukprot:CAMPEP_0113700806 /NCGR_PEP_ID=MMETSP0038_2-20120614/24188_1 /TAXON_ID=2898 /ORGANISM="Cryptomonas paramecium" /LENGTH=96 /DNA_ID=CAMNT_0000624557 /DNA_START=44 /DNA_END=334 /DNA_ORIENTATION=- /assembly_acc=CAM_ASM_000170